MLRGQRGQVGVEAGDLIVEIADLGFGVAYTKIRHIRPDNLGFDRVENCESRRLCCVAFLQRLDVVENGALAS